MTERTSDTELISILKELALAEMMTSEKNSFLKDYDSITNDLYKSFRIYYTREYTNNELKELVHFFNDDFGKKISNDLVHILRNDLFVKNSSLSERIERLKRKLSENVIDCNSTIKNEMFVFSEDFVKYANLIGLYEHLAIVRDNEAMWVLPQDEERFKECFDTIAEEYVKDVEQYFYAHYTKVDIKNLNRFANTALGQKVITNTEKYVQLRQVSYQNWEKSYAEIWSNLMHGKYQKD